MYHSDHPFFNKNISVEYPLYIKQLKVNMLIRPFRVEDNGKSLKFIPPISTLYIQFPKQYGEYVSQTQQRLQSYPVSPNNLFDLQRTITEALSWYSNENRIKIYAKTDSGVLVFNPEYESLQAQCSHKTLYEKYAIRFAPTILEVGTGLFEPAMIVYINRQSQYCVILESEFKIFAEFILGFDFKIYEQNIINSIMYCVETNSIMKPEDVKSRQEYKRNGDS